MVTFCIGKKRGIYAIRKRVQCRAMNSQSESPGGIGPENGAQFNVYACSPGRIGFPVSIGIKIVICISAEICFCVLLVALVIYDRDSDRDPQIPFIARTGGKAEGQFCNAAGSSDIVELIELSASANTFCGWAITCVMPPMVAVSTK